VQAPYAVDSSVRKSSARGILRLFHPPSSRGRKVTIVLHGYFDGSGTHEDSNVLSIAGFIGEEDAFVDLDRKWDEVLDNPRWPTRLSEFHMVDCVHGDGEFLKGGWTYPERLALYGDFTQVIVGACATGTILPIGAATVTGIFKQIAEADLDLLKAEALGTPFDLTFQLLLQQILHRASERWPNETLGLLYDKGNKPEADRFGALCNEYAARFHAGDILHSWGQADSKQFTPLQAADLFAFGTLHLAQLNHFPREAEPYFPTIPAFWNMLLKIAADGGIYDLEALNKLLPKVRAKERMPTKQELHDNKY